MWVDEARFKHLATEDDRELAGITSFARSVAAALVNLTDVSSTNLRSVSAGSIRESILASGRPYVALLDLLSLCWGVGIPIAHLRVFPWPQKRMAAMAASVGDRPTVLLGKDAMYPAPIAFYVAHELGHIALSHVVGDSAVIDLDLGDVPRATDAEEAAADAFALELLTGLSSPTVLPAEAGATPSARGLAAAALKAADALHIEPGTLALCYGYSTQDWAVANGALHGIYDAPRPVWQVVNDIAAEQLQIRTARTESADFLAAVLDTGER